MYSNGQLRVRCTTWFFLVCSVIPPTTEMPKLFRAWLECCITGIARQGYVFNESDTKKTLIFKREPDNKYDSNCIQVWLNNKHIGWIKKEDAKGLAPVLDRNKTSITRWGVVTKTNGYLMVHIDMKFHY